MLLNEGSLALVWLQYGAKTLENHYFKLRLVK